MEEAKIKMREFEFAEDIHWNGDTFSSIRKMVDRANGELDKKRNEVILQHFECDMSAFRRYLQDQREPSCNVDFIRRLNDFGLAFLLMEITHDHNVLYWLKWLRQEKSDSVADAEVFAEHYERGLDYEQG